MRDVGDGPPIGASSVDGDPAAGSAGVGSASGSSGCPGGVAGVLAHFADLRAQLEAADGVTASNRLADLDAAAAVLDGLRLLAVSRVEGSGVWREDPNATAASFLRARHRRSHPESSADLRAAQALTDFPVLRDAVEDGRVSRAHVDVIVAVGQRNPTRSAALPDFLPAFIQIATQSPAATLRTVMRQWADQIDPLATAGDEHDAHRRRYLHITHVGDGVAVDGFFGREQGAKLLAAMNAALSDLHRHRTDTGGPGGAGSGGLGAGAADTSGSGAAGGSGEGMVVSTAQRRADALVSLMDRVLADGGLPASGGSRPCVTVTVPLARLEQPCHTPTNHDDLLDQVSGGRSDGLNQLDPHHLFADGCAHLAVSNGPGRDLISAQAAQRLTCDCDIHRIVLNPDGLPVDVGRKMRTFPAHLRKALEIRDGGCVFPGCDRPPGWAEAHHILHWAHGGTTSLNNAALLCSRHHHDVHTNNHDVHIGADGRATVTLHRQRL